MKKFVILSFLVIGCVDPGKTLETSRHKLIELDDTGSPCTGAGWDWNSTTKTCKMTADLVNQQVRITSHDLVLDCDGYVLCTVDGSDCDDPIVRLTATMDNDWGNGIQSRGWNNVKVLNCETRGFNEAGVELASASTYADPVTGLLLQNFKGRGASSYTNAYPDASVYVKNPSHGVVIRSVNDSLFQQIDVSGSAQGALEGVDTFNDNVVQNVFAHHNLSVGFSFANNTRPASNNLIENFVYEQTDGRSAVAMTLFKMDNTTVRHLVARPDPATPGASYLTGLQIAGSNNIVEYSDIRGAKNSGINPLVTGAFATGSLTVRYSAVTDSGGGIVVPASSTFSVMLTNNTFCNDPAKRYNSPTSAGLRYSDITRRYNTTAATATAFGGANVCGYTSTCSQSGTTFSCEDNSVFDYRDIGAPPGQPCSFTCD